MPTDPDRHSPDRPRLLITGMDGFVGGWLTRTAEPEWRCLPLAGADGKSVDLRDGTAVRAAVSAAGADAVIHLAAQSHVPSSFADPSTTFSVNVVGTVNLLAALQAVGFAGPVLMVSTGDAYGPVAEQDLPIREDRPLAPANPYAASKACAEVACAHWARHGGGMRVVVARAFNHIGPGQDQRFAVSAFARQIAAMRRSGGELVVGDIDTTRDFTDVRDVVMAYLALLEHGRNGSVYNVCSGQETSLREILRRMLRIAGIEAEPRVDPAKLRPVDQRRVRGDPQALMSATGWRPTIPLDRSLADILDYWQQKDHP